MSDDRHEVEATLQEWVEWLPPDHRARLEYERLRDAQVQAAPPPSEGLDREALGRLVRETWIEWAREQPDPKPHWLVTWDELAEPDREVDRRIGERVASRTWTDAVESSAAFIEISMDELVTRVGGRLDTPGHRDVTLLLFQSITDTLAILARFVRLLRPGMKVELSGLTTPGPEGQLAPSRGARGDSR